MDGGGAGAGGAYTSAFNGALMTIKVNFKVLQSAVYPGIAGLCGSFANVRLKKHVVGAYLYNDGAYKIYLYTFSSAAAYSQTAGSVTISLNTDYWIELGANGSAWTLKVFSDAAKTVQVGSTLTITSDAEVSKLAPAFSFLYSNVNPNGSFDLFSVESAQMGAITYETDTTDPGAGNVKKDTGYYINGVSKTGTLESTDPGVANVLKDVAYKIESADKVGTFDEAARNTDPGAANVLVGAGTYKILNVTKTPTFDEAARNVSAGAGNILLGASEKIQNVTINGTFDESARNTDPGEANVVSPTAYKILNVNKTGTYTPPVATPPSAPVITLGTISALSIPIAITGQAGATHTVKLIRRLTGAVVDTQTRTGDGSVTMTATVRPGIYDVLAYSTVSGLHSTPVTLAKGVYILPSGDGPLIEAIERARDMLADSATWQALCEAAGDPVTARAHTFSNALNAQNAGDDVDTYHTYVKTLRPWAIFGVGAEGGFTARRNAIGYQFSFAESGGLRIGVNMLTPAAYQDVNKKAEAANWADTQIGNIIRDMESLAGQPGKLSSVEITIEEGPSRADESLVPNEGDWWGTTLKLQWGV
jgi:hypothetical protein